MILMRDYRPLSDLLIHCHDPVELERRKAIEIAGLHKAADDGPRGGYAYFVGAGDIAVKIGFSFEPVHRLSGIQTCSPVRVQLLATRKGGLLREHAYHEQFRHLRLHGEWFRHAPELTFEIDRLVKEARVEARRQKARERNALSAPDIFAGCSAFSIKPLYAPQSDPSSSG